jgi:hypothetical protein
MLYGSIVVSNIVLKFVALLSLFEGYEVTLDVEFNELSVEYNIIYNINNISFPFIVRNQTYQYYLIIINRVNSLNLYIM